MSLEEFLIKSLIWLVLIAIGWYFGTRAERNHLKSLMADEQKYQHIQVSSERFYEPKGVNESILVVGSVVIAQDKFKQVVAAMLSLFGKNLTVYETLLDRARREARCKVVLRYWLMVWQLSDMSVSFNHQNTPLNNFFIRSSGRILGFCR